MHHFLSIFVFIARTSFISQCKHLALLLHRDPGLKQHVVSTLLWLLVGVSISRPHSGGLSSYLSFSREFEVLSLTLSRKISKILYFLQTIQNPKWVKVTFLCRVTALMLVHKVCTSSPTFLLFLCVLGRLLFSILFECKFFVKLSLGLA